MKKIVDVIKLGESVGRKLSDNATETDKRDRKSTRLNSSHL